MHDQAKAGDEAAIRLLASVGKVSPMAKARARRCDALPLKDISSLSPFLFPQVFIEPLDAATRKQFGVDEGGGEICAWSPFMMKERRSGHTIAAQKPSLSRGIAVGVLQEPGEDRRDDRKRRIRQDWGRGQGG